MAAEQTKNTAMSIVESIVGCKWSLRVIDAIKQGKTRPGEMKRAIPGISEKVLNERLKKFVRFELVVRKVFPEVPPRVEYKFSPKGKKFLKVLDSIEKFSEG
jgi:DNA-binding HxlR family transcriptional regulator